MTITKLTPGTPVWHPDHGYGTVGKDGFAIIHEDGDGDPAYTTDLYGWQPVTVVRPGEVAVRVDDVAEKFGVWGYADEPAESTVRHLGARVGLFRHPNVPGHLVHSELPDAWRREGCSAWMDHHFVLDHGDHFETVCPDGTVTAQPPSEPVVPDEPTKPGSRWRLDGKRCVRDASPKGRLAWLDVDSIGDWCSWADFTSHVEGWGTPGGQDAEATLAKVKRLASHPDDKMAFGEWHRALLATLGVSVNDVSASVRRLIGEGS